MTGLARRGPRSRGEQDHEEGWLESEPVHLPYTHNLGSQDGFLLSKRDLVADPDAGVPVPDSGERGMSPISTLQVGMKDVLELTFQLDEIDEWGRLTGFKRVDQWIDEEWPFAETLFEAQ